MEPLILCWWGNELRLVFSSGEVHHHSLAENSKSSDSILSHLINEKPKNKSVRIIYYSDKLSLNSIKELRLPVVKDKASKRKRTDLELKLRNHFPALAQSTCLWSLTYNLRLSNHFSSLALINDPDLIELIKGLKKIGYSIEGVWPLPFLMHALPKKQNEDAGSFCIACTDKQLLITTTSISGDWKCDNIPIHLNNSVTLSGLQNARLRFEEEMPPSGWLATDQSSEHNPYIYHCRDLGLNEIMLSHVLYNTRHLSVSAWENTCFENINRSSIFTLRTVLLLLTTSIIIAGIYFEKAAILEKNLRLEKTKKEAFETEQISKENHAKEMKTKDEILTRDYNLLINESQAVDKGLIAIAESCINKYTIESLHIVNDSIQMILNSNESSAPRAKLTDLCSSLNSSQNQWSFSVQPNQDTALRIKGYHSQSQITLPTNIESKVNELLLHLNSVNSFNKIFSEIQSHWTINSHKKDSYSTFVVQHIDLYLIDTHVDSWPTILNDIHSLSLIPNLSLNEVHLTLDLENPSFFKEAWIRLTARTTP